MFIKTKNWLLSACAAGLLIAGSSCSEKEELTPEIKNNASLEVTATEMANFESLGFDVSDMRKMPNDNPFTGEAGGINYLLEGDIVISEENMKEMLQSENHHVGPVGEQYRTSNLVSSPRTINVIGYTGGSNALSSKMRTALQWAINNYNRLNTGLNFTLTFGTRNYASYDIVVYKNPNGQVGGSAGFPQNGRPFQYVQIYSGMDSYDTNTNEHVMTHEIGHAVGLRHTDFFNRSLSCGTGGNEGSGGVGAIHIPGTPTGFDPNSIMLSCFGQGEDGEFGQFDVTALEFLY
jgi:hypothetical protein